MGFTFRYMRDEEVNDDLDRQLRALLLECFPHNATLLETQRYFKEIPQNRWFAFDENGTLAAHIAAHEKLFGAGEDELKVLGIADVAVSPQFRGRGLVKTILNQVHDWGREKGFTFAALAGRTEIYSSSGYRNASNPIRVLDLDTGQYETSSLGHFMYRPLGEKVWPDGVIDLRGPSF